VSQTAINGSGRVLQCRGFFVAEGKGPLFQLRAVLSLIALAAAAATCVFPSFIFCLINLTCASRTIGSPEPPNPAEALCFDLRTRSQDGRDRQK